MASPTPLPTSDGATALSTEEAPCESFMQRAERSLIEAKRTRLYVSADAVLRKFERKLLDARITSTPNDANPRPSSSIACRSMRCLAQHRPGLCCRWPPTHRRIDVAATAPPAAAFEIDRLLSLEPGATMVSVSTWAEKVCRPDVLNGALKLRQGATSAYKLKCCGTQFTRWPTSSCTSA